MASKDSDTPEERPDHKRFTELVELHHVDLFRFLKHYVGNRHDAEEILQIAWTHAWEKFDQLRDENLFSAWMRSICITLHVRHLRTLARARKKYLGLFEERREAFEQHAGTDNATERKWIREEEYQVAAILLQSLPAPCREVFELRYLRGHTIQEIAEKLGISPGTVKQRLTKGRTILKMKRKSFGDGFFENG